MKHLILLSLFTFHFSLFTLSASAAVPLHWTVETSRATPAQFEAYQGETLAFEAALQSYGKPLEAPSSYSLYWQTNGMGSTYWSVPCIQTFEQSEHSNILYATWSPTNDVGARVYNCFIGQPGTIYHAAFQLRLRPSPGATPNELPLPQKVIDFAKVTVLNPPWSGGGGGGVDTNAVIDIIHKTVDGAAHPLPKYLHLYEANDSYPAEADEYYRQRGSGVPAASCSSVRSGGYLSRNFDYPFDDRAEFVVRMSAGTVPSASSPTGASTHRFSSVGVAQVGTNLTEQIVTSGKWSKWYKALPGATVDGINENGVACNINVVDGDPQTSGWHTTGSLHPLAAIRWILDNATNAAHAAEYIAANIRFPEGWTQNFHYMVADAGGTWIVENGIVFFEEPDFTVTLTNFNMTDCRGEGIERFDLLVSGANITNAWYTRAYRRETNPPWVSDLREVLAYTNDIYNAWASHPKEYFRNRTNVGQPWWQTVHTSVYDLTNRVLRVAVQEQDDWYVFQVPSSGSGKAVDAYTKAETDEKLAEKHPLNGELNILNGLAFYGASGVRFRTDVGRYFFNSSGDAEFHDVSVVGLEGISVARLQFGSYADSEALERSDWNFIRAGSYDSGWHYLWDDVTNEVGNAKYTPSATDPTFSNAVDTIVRSIMPTKLRAYDPVRQCWWNIQPVNGVLTLTVED